METNTVRVAISSIWSKRYPGDNPVTYSILVPRHEDAESMLNEAFIATNRDDRPFTGGVCSTSSGDLMILDDRHYLVAPSGFTPISQTQFEQIRKLTSRDTSFGLAWMIEHCGVSKE